jgi:hypothetical protein
MRRTRSVAALLLRPAARRPALRRIIERRIEPTVFATRSFVAVTAPGHRRDGSNLVRSSRRAIARAASIPAGAFVPARANSFATAMMSRPARHARPPTVKLADVGATAHAGGRPAAQASVATPAFHRPPVLVRTRKQVNLRQQRPGAAPQQASVAAARRIVQMVRPAAKGRAPGGEVERPYSVRPDTLRSAKRRNGGAGAAVAAMPSFANRAVAPNSVEPPLRNPLPAAIRARTSRVPVAAALRPAGGRRPRTLVRADLVSPPVARRRERAELATSALSLAVRSRAASVPPGAGGPAEAGFVPARAVRAQREAQTNADALAEVERAITAKLQKQIDTRVADTVKNALGADADHARQMADRIDGVLHDRLVLERERQG